MKNKILVIGGFILAISIILNFNSCNEQAKQKVTIEKIEKELEIAERKGSFDTIKNPEPIIIRDTIEGEVKVVKNPVNQKLLKDFQKLSDSLKKLEAYIDAITIRKYSETFEDEFLKATFDTEVTGRLNSIVLSDYLIKKQKVKYYETIKTKEYFKEPVFSMYIGGGLMSEFVSQTTPTFEVNFGWINKKGTHFEFSYNTREEFGFSLKQNLFTICK